MALAGLVLTIAALVRSADGLLSARSGRQAPPGARRSSMRWDAVRYRPARW